MNEESKFMSIFKTMSLFLLIVFTLSNILFESRACFQISRIFFVLLGLLGMFLNYNRIKSDEFFIFFAVFLIGLFFSVTSFDEIQDLSCNGDCSLRGFTNATLLEDGRCFCYDNNITYINIQHVSEVIKSE